MYLFSSESNDGFTQDDNVVHTGCEDSVSSDCGEKIENKADTCTGHNDSQQAEGEAASGDSTSCICGLCGRIFTQKRLLSQHMHSHKGEGPFSCRKCRKSFSKKSNLNEHLRTHTGHRPFICSFCGKGFYRSTHLKVHIHCHTREKPYRCQRCHRNFADFCWLLSLCYGLLCCQGGPRLLPFFSAYPAR